MFYLPDPDTGYYDPEEAFYELDAAHEETEDTRLLAAHNSAPRTAKLDAFALRMAGDRDARKTHTRFME